MVHLWGALGGAPKGALKPHFSYALIPPSRRGKLSVGGLGYFFFDHNPG
jgi:hypothetical protein